MTDKKNICRLCCTGSLELSHLFTDEKNAGLIPLISQYLSIEIKEDDNLPIKICNICTQKLQGLKCFVEKCQKNQEKLTALCNGIKQEALLSEKNEGTNDADDILMKNDESQIDEELFSSLGQVTKKLKRRRNKASQTTLHQCPSCPKTFKKSGSLLNHKIKMHKEKSEKTNSLHQCPSCPKTFKKSGMLLNHRFKMHKEVIGKNRCTHCDKTFLKKYLLERHLLVHTQKRPVSCDVCEKTFKCNSDLRHHKKTHLPLHVKYKYNCDLCGQSFTQKSNLESHRRVHNGIKPFVCDLCNKAFSQKNNMEEHRRSHTGEKPFQCKICDKSFSRQGSLGIHLKRHRGEKPHKCRFCGKEFLRRGVLLKHEYIHTNTRPYQCGYCTKSFRDQGKRKVHERLHTGERPYECDVCGKGFCESGNLNKHKKVHDKQPHPTPSLELPKEPVVKQQPVPPAHHPPPVVEHPPPPQPQPHQVNTLANTFNNELNQFNSYNLNSWHKVAAMNPNLIPQMHNPPYSIPSDTTRPDWLMYNH